MEMAFYVVTLTPDNVALNNIRRDRHGKPHNTTGQQIGESGRWRYQSKMAATGRTTAVQYGHE